MGNIISGIINYDKRVTIIYKETLSDPLGLRETHQGRTNSLRVQTSLEKVWFSPGKQRSLPISKSWSWSGVVGQIVHPLQYRREAGVDVQWESEHQKGAVLPNERDGRDGKGGSGERLGGCRSSFCLECDLLSHRCTGLEGPCGESTDTSTGKRPSEHSVCVEAPVAMSRGLWKCYLQEGLQDHRGMVFYAHIWGWLCEMSSPSYPQPPRPDIPGSPFRCNVPSVPSVKLNIMSTLKRGA